MTLAELRAYWRVITDNPNTAVWGNTNVNLMLNGAYREIINEIMGRDPMYFHKSSTVSTTANTPYTDLPSDCVVINKIINSSEETLPYFDMTQQNMDEGHSQPTNFATTGPHIFWYPVPDSTYTFTIYYHYSPSDMSGDSDSPVLPPGYHDLVAWGAAINSRTAKEEQLQEYIMKYEKKLKLLLRTIMIKQTNEAPRIKEGGHDFYEHD